MRKLRSGRPSPAMVVAVIALTGALAGTAIAGPEAVVSALNIKKVRKVAKRVANKQITRRAPGLSVKSAKSANSAGNVNGVTIRRFFKQVPPNTSNSLIGNFGPMTLRATCDGAGVPTLRASWSETVDHLTFNGATGAQFGTATVNPNTTINIGSGTFGSVGLAEAIGFNSKFHTSVEYFLRDAPRLGVNQCFYSGFVSIG